MSINKNINTIAWFVDRALDEKDIDTLKRISEDCLNLIESNDYNNLEKAILAYHSATSWGNYITIFHKGYLSYSNADNNEADFEFCLMLFRNSLQYFKKFYEDSNGLDKANDEDRYYYLHYINRTLTNYANDLHQCGRFIKSINQLKFGVEKNFSMAVGNMACKLITYAMFDYDNGHCEILCNEAYHLLLKAIDDTTLQEHAAEYFRLEIERLENVISVEFLKNKYQPKEFSLGDTLEEQNYRKWCLKNTLFLNTLNDIYSCSLVANDCLHLPTMITDINVGPKYHGLFNQLKQEYVSARFLAYDGLKNREVHFSDKDVYMCNTLDYPVYGLGIEKIKCAYRSLYSLFDRIAFFINEYYGLGIKEQDVSYKTIWQNKIRGYAPKLNLKDYIVEKETYNYPMIGLYWLCKDIAKKQVKHHYLEPLVEMLSDIRNALEHRYLKVHDRMFFPRTEDAFNDTLAKSIYFKDLENAVIELMKYVREAIILLALSVHKEEQIREKGRREDGLIMPIYVDKYDDEWKQIF